MTERIRFGFDEDGVPFLKVSVSGIDVDDATVAQTLFDSRKSAQVIASGTVVMSAQSSVTITFPDRGYAPAIFQYADYSKGGVGRSGELAIGTLTVNLPMVIVGNITHTSADFKYSAAISATVYGMAFGMTF